METNGKEIRKLVARFDDGKNQRTVEIQDVTDNKAAVVALDFNSFRDDVAWRHGFITDIQHLKDVSIVFANGEKLFLGDPPVNKPIAINLVVEHRTGVL